MYVIQLEKEREFCWEPVENAEEHKSDKEASWEDNQ